MKRESIVALLLALLAVVALGVAAATLDTAVTTDGGDFGGGGAGDGVAGQDSPERTGMDAERGGSMNFSLAGVCYEWLADPPALLALLGLFGLVGWLAYRDTGSLFAGVVVAGTIFLPVGVAWVLLTSCREVEFDPQFALADDEGDAFLSPGGGAPGVGGEGDAVSTPEALFLLVVVAALIASVLVLIAAAGDDEDDGTRGGDETEVPGDESEPDLVAVGRTAGAAADRIESGEADNEVYRAWREMTEVLDVDRPASSTPAEFAAAAVDAGVEPEPVERLTDVFERVRYGGADPTGDRERRAVDALRRIEAAHREDADVGRPDGGGGDR